MERELSEELQTALFDLQRYLLDEVPPLTISDSIETLMPHPPGLVVRQIHSWAVELGRTHGVSMVDCLFHALQKIHMMGTLKLIDRATMDQFLAGVIPLAMEVCPPDDRDRLRSNLQAMRDSRSLTGPASSGSTDSIARTTKSEPRADNVVTRGAKRLSSVIDRLTKFLPGRAAVPAAMRPPEAAAGSDIPQDEPAAQLVAMAAANATSEQELLNYIDKLRPLTGEADTTSLIRLLAASVPRWEIIAPPDTVVKPSAPVEAMHKIITLTRDSLESTKRFRELMMTAIEQFNADGLPVAVSMLEVADVVIVEKKIDPTAVERIRADAIESISAEQLKKYAENKSRHALLRKALNFFPTLRVSHLFQDLRGEERPERRRSILGLLEAYGTMARDIAVPELESELQRPPGEIDTYYLRNLIYLLHRIPRDPDTPFEKEIDLLTRSSARGQSIYVVKEAILPLGQLKNDAAVKLLTMRLAEFESLLVRGDTTYPVDEMQKLLDRIVTALARIATPAALLTVARHGMKPTPILGDTRGRLAVLAQHDLSFDEQTVNLIIKMIREDLPKKILGQILPSRQPPPLKLIEALSSTRSEPVESLLEEIARKFPDHEVGRAASAAIANLAEAGKQVATDKRRATLTGDLQFFGLPSLMQSLADSQASGIVTLNTLSGHTAGKILFVEGKFAEAQAAHLRGADAIYQLLERPVVGTFAFVPQPPTSLRTKSEPQSVMQLLFEGVRRHDELKQAMMFVPDDLVLKATGVKPTQDGEETDPAVVREVWVKASGGGKVGEWESQVPADAYRVRRLVAHWLDEGALEPVAS